MNFSSHPVRYRISMTLTLILPLACWLSLFAAHASLPGDEHWDSQFGAPGTSDQLWSITALGGNVYVGGLLTSAGNTKANFVAGYDGSNWFKLNNGVAGGFNITYVFGLANDGANLFAGGWFTNADNCGAMNLARWDGTSWSPLAGGSPNSIVELIKKFGTNYYVGGVFTTNGTVPANRIARWDGSRWYPLGSGVSGGSLPGVVAIESDGANVYVGGTFTQAGSVNATNVAVWNGSAWSAMGTGLSGSVLTLASYGGYLYAGGSFTNSALGIVNLARWDGSSWSTAGSGTDRAVRDLISDGTNLYVGGDFTVINGTPANRIAKFDGSSWSPLGAGIQGFGAGASPGVYKMAFDTNWTLYVAGNFNQAGGVGASHVAGWDGQNWFALGASTSHGMTHFSGTVNSVINDGANLYVSGNFTEAGTNVSVQVAEWNGTSWTALGTATPGVLPTAGPRTLALANGILYAGGLFTNLGPYAVNRIGQWDGSSWSDIGGADSSVLALTFDGTYLWIGGAFTNIASGYSPGLAAYSPGVGWYTVGTVAGGTHTVNCIAYDGANIYIGGNFTSVNGVSAVNVAKFDYNSWSPLGNGVNNTVSAIVATNGLVYAGGTFTSAGAVAANRLAVWNGSSWSPLGSGLTGSSSTASVASIALNGNLLYAGGSFTNAGGVYAPGIAQWDGTKWSGLGSGLFLSVFNGPGSTRGMTVLGNDLYVGGSMTAAGDKPAMFFSRWNDQLNFYPPPNPELIRGLWLANRQFQFRLTGTSGESYILQGSTDLMTWTPLMTNSTTLYDYVDTNAAKFPNRFYRAVLGP
jgi:hypothetical protein